MSSHTDLNIDSSLGFTLIEIVVAVAIFAILTVVAISALNPVEQINRGKDEATLNTASELYQSLERLQANNGSSPWDQSLQAEVLTSDQGDEILNSLVERQELKKSFVTRNDNYLARLYISTSNNFEQISICFTPDSTAFQNHELAQYNQRGIEVEVCTEDECYICLTNHNLSQLDDDEQGEDEDEEDEPEQTDSYPNLPWTCVSSDLYQDYGCNNFCTHDLGCVEPCEEGQRLLMKSYGHAGAGLTECTDHYQETKEYYCVDDPHARCELTDGDPSWVESFYWNWSLSAPIRWVEPGEPDPVWKPFAL